MVRQSKYKDYLVFNMPERYDSELANSYKTEISKMISAGQKKIIFDFTETKIINSPEIGLLISVFRTLKEKNGDLIIVGLSENLQQIFSLTKLDKIFKIYPTVESII